MDAFTPLPAKCRPLRDRLRVIGRELVRLRDEDAAQEAARFRHPPADYEFCIYPIFTIGGDGQIYVEDNPFHTSATALEGWITHFEEQARPSLGGVVKGWAKDYWLFTLAAAPASFAMLGLAVLGEKQAKREQDARAQRLASLSEFPKFRRDI